MGKWYKQIKKYKLRNSVYNFMGQIRIYTLLDRIFKLMDRKR